MGASTQFERLSAWLRGQQRSVERVNLGQASAKDLVGTAEYELLRLRDELNGVLLDSVRPSSGPDVGQADQVLVGTASLVGEDASAAMVEVEREAGASAEPARASRGRGPRRLADRLAEISDDAA